MKGNEAILKVISGLETAGIDYMVTGSYASNVHGVPRSTKDADLIIEAPAEQVHRFLDSLEAPLRSDPQMLIETITSSRRWIVRIERSAFVVELFLLTNESFDRSRFDRRIQREVLPGEMAWLPTPEDVVIQKLRWSTVGQRPKDFKDACDVIGVQQNQLDWSYIERWCGELGAAGALAKARAIAEF